MNTRQTVKGFTIIEVVLVLAIAGLIFLMVFIALPALQSSQRDTARKGDVSTVASSVNSYISGNRGNFPDTSQLETQLGATGADANKKYTAVSTNFTNTVVETSAAPGEFTVPESEIRVYKGLKCVSNGPNGKVTLEKGTSRQYATIAQLEGGNKSGYCLDT